MQEESKSRFRKKLLIAFTMVLSIGTILYFLFTTNGIKALAKTILTLKPQWLFMACAAAVVGWLLEGLGLYLLCRHLYPKWKYYDSFTIGMVGLLYSALTPFATGGQPMQIYTLRSMGMDTGRAGSVIAVKTLIYQVIMVVYAMIMIAAKLSYFQTNVSNFSFITVIGVIANSLFICAVFLFMLSEKATNRILLRIIHILARMKLCRHPEERYEKIHSELSLFHDASRTMGKSSLLYVATMMITIVQITLNSLIPFFIYRSFGLHGAHVTTMVAAQVFVAMVSAFVPLPGASGGAEGSFFLFFGLYFGETVWPALILWRFITYFANIVFGSAFTYIGSKLRQIKG